MVLHSSNLTESILLDIRELKRVVGRIERQHTSVSDNFKKITNLLEEQSKTSFNIKGSDYEVLLFFQDIPIYMYTLYYAYRADWLLNWLMSFASL